jgi:hypothetical protein
MTARNTTWFSEVAFQADPADAKHGLINLGFLLEFTTSNYWVVGSVMRGTLADEQLTGLDELSRSLIEHRVDVIKREMDRVLPAAKEPGSALALLAAANPWSFKVTPPRRVHVPSTVQVGGIEKVLDGYVSSLYVTEWLPSVQAQETPATRAAAPRRAIGARPVSIPLDLPKPWMLPPTAVMRPLVHAA